MKRFFVIIITMTLLATILTQTYAIETEPIIQPLSQETSAEKILLSTLSESECIEFISHNNVQIPNDYDEAIWAPFVKKVICQVEEDPNYQFSFNYTVTLAFANAIKAAVNEYYGCSNYNIALAAEDSPTEETPYILQYSEAIDTWNVDFNNYNCYIFSIGVPDKVYKNPGYYSGQTFSMIYDLTGIANIVEADLLALHHRDITISTEPNTSNPCTSEQIICFRKGQFDYHFMRFAIGYWFHKPGTSVPLKYLSTPSNTEFWTNEGVFEQGTLEGDEFYTSDIIYISYDGHDWDYSSNNNGTHTKSCSICGDVFTENCNMEYTNITDTRHSAECTKCDYAISSEACTLTYTSNGDKTHTIACTGCGNSFTADCGFVSTYSASDQHYSECSQCGAEYLEDCDPVSTYCGNATIGNVHTDICADCGHQSGTATQACTFTYKSYGNNTHVRECTQCRHVDGIPMSCVYKADNTCRFCGALKGSAVINKNEEDFSEN